MANVKELNVNSTTYDIVGKAVVDENNAGTPIKTWTGTSSSLPVSPSSDTLYYVTDTKQILLGSTILSDGLKKTYDLFDFKWSDHELTDQSWLRADTFSWQDGEVYADAFNHLNTDFQNGTDESETIGSYTIDYVLAPDGHKIVLPNMETTVANIYAESGVAWYYVLDRVNDRFKLPRTKFGFTGYRDAVGNYISAGLPNITGRVGVLAYYNQDHTGGAFYKYGQNGTNGSLNSSNNNGDYGFDASRSNAIYGASTTVQPPATQMYLYFYVGQFSQSATEQTAGITTAQLNNKVDLDAGNFDATGKSSIAGFGMPSSSYENLTLGADGSTYTPTASGYYSLKCIINNTGAYVQFVVDNLYSSMIARDGGNGVTIWIPVQKGETCTFHTNANLYVESFKFVYAQGEV